jgi:pimeloyl-ACP methyl ester carboxylesterase
VETNWVIQRPEGVTTVLHPVIVLPDKGDAALPNDQLKASSPFQRYGLPDALTNAVPNLAAPFALCAVDAMVLPNGPDSYYHPRSAGGKTVDSGKMILEEFIPRLADLGLDISKVAFWGWFMGGYGALRLGAIYNQQNPGRVAGIVAVNPALGVNSSPDPAGFDGSDDYRQNSVWNQSTLDELNKIPLRVDYGTSNTFSAGDRQLLSRLTAKTDGGSASGGDSDQFLKTLVPDELQFLGKCFGSKR